MTGITKRPVVAALSLVLLTATPLHAQWIGPGEWGSPDNVQLIEPGTWMVSFRGSGSQRSVAASAQGQNYVGTLEFWCRRDDPAGGLMFYDFVGSTLKTVPKSHPEETREQVIFDFDGRAFRIQFTYVPWDRVWLGHGILTQAFLEAFAGSRQLEIRNLAGERVNVFPLRGTRKAQQSMQQVCGN